MTQKRRIYIFEPRKLDFRFPHNPEARVITLNTYIYIRILLFPSPSNNNNNFKYFRFVVVPASVRTYICYRTQRAKSCYVILANFTKVIRFNGFRPRAPFIPYKRS